MGLFVAACASTKPYIITSSHPNLTAEVQMEDDGIFYHQATKLYIYEIKGDCEQYYHGFVDLFQGQSSVTLPVGKDLMVTFVRSSKSYSYESTNTNTIRLRPQAGHQYLLRWRERNGSNEISFLAKDGHGDFRAIESAPFPQCKQVRYSE